MRAPLLVIFDHVEIRELLFKLLVSLRFILRWEMGNDIAAAITEEFKRLLVLPIRPLQLDDENVQACSDLAWSDASNFVFLPNLNPLRERMAKGLVVEIGTVAHSP